MQGLFLAEAGISAIKGQDERLGAFDADKGIAVTRAAIPPELFGIEYDCAIEIIIHEIGSCV